MLVFVDGRLILRVEEDDVVMATAQVSMRQTLALNKYTPKRMEVRRIGCEEVFIKPLLALLVYLS